MPEEQAGPVANAPFDFDSAAVDGPLDRRLINGLAKIGLASRHRAWQEAEGRGLTPTQGQVLAFLGQHQDAARLSEIVEALAVTPATASLVVDALIRKGLASKARNASDARALAITLTEAGRDEADRTAGWSDFLLAAVDTLTPAEQGIFLRGLVKMIRTLQEKGEVPISRMCVTCRYFRPNAHRETARPHHCAFVDAPFGDHHLRLDCMDHQGALADQAEHAWEEFIRVR